MIGQDMIGKYVIVRCYSAGVHAGTLAELDGDKAVLTDSNRLWYWVAREGVALSGVAQNGIAKGESKIDVINPSIYLTGVIEVIPATTVAQESIRGK